MTYKYDKNCLHCEIEKLIENWKWRGELTAKQKKRMIWKDLLQVLIELPFFKVKD